MRAEVTAFFPDLLLLLWFALFNYQCVSLLQVVRSILQGTLAVMLKRGWIETTQDGRAAFFQVTSYA